MSIMAARSDRALRTTGEVLASQTRALVTASPTPPPAALARLVVLLDDLTGALDHPTNARHQTWSSLLDHRQVGRAHLDELSDDQLHSASPAVLVRLAAARQAELASRLDGPLPASVSNQFGNSNLVDYLRATLLEVCVLAHSAGCLEPAALRMCVRSLSQALGERFGGQTIEVRIPPASAVQVGAFGEGPTHTRGTPPNVVETDEPTWFCLGTGLDRLPDALDAARAVGSGSHYRALERMVPVIDLAHIA